MKNFTTSWKRTALIAYAIIMSIYAFDQHLKLEPYLVQENWETDNYYPIINDLSPRGEEILNDPKSDFWIGQNDREKNKLELSVRFKIDPYFVASRLLKHQLDWQKVESKIRGVFYENALKKAKGYTFIERSEELIDGMTYKDVEIVFGFEGRKFNTYAQTTVYEWGDKAGFVYVYFENDALKTVDCRPKSPDSASGQ